MAFPVQKATMRSSRRTSRGQPAIKTSAQIIEEARRSVTLIPTSRPYTPAGGRNLFGTNRPTNNRPPSTVSLSHPSYIDESSLQVKPVIPGIHLDPIKQISAPPTPVQSLVDINVTTPTNIHAPYPPLARTPEMKKSKSSPTTSKRVVSAERKSGRGSSGGTQEKAGVREGSHGNQRITSATKQEAIQEWEKRVTPLLTTLNNSVGVAGTNESVGGVFDRLWEELRNGQFLGRTAGQAGRGKRTLLLKCLFPQLNSKDPAVLSKLLKIILSMKVVGGNLLKVCQHVFVLSREEGNDQYLIREDIAGPLLEALSTIDPLNNTDAVVYGMGAVKLISTNQKLRLSLKEMGVVKMIANYLGSCQGDSVLPSTIIVQLVATLRNLSDGADMYDDFLSCNIPPLLSQVVSRHYQDNTEVVFYTSRFLSKLTLHTECGRCITNCEEFLSMVPQLLANHVQNPDIVVRLCFILNNLSSSDPLLAHNLYHTHKLSPSIDKALNHYLVTLETQETDQTIKTSTSSNDVMIKLVSLLANSCVHQSVAVELLSAKQPNILNTLLNVMGHSSTGEELVINVMITFNNLSYYSDGQNEMEKDIARGVLQLMLINNDQLLLECVRVLGNISKQPAVRDILAANRVDELLITVLDSSKLELVYATCGVLVNITGDPKHKSILEKNQGVTKLVDVLSHFGRQDWQLSSLVCKILWNYCDGESLSREEGMNISHLLEEFLDPVTAFTAYMMEEEEGEEGEIATSNEASSQSHTCWEKEFSPVAKLLLQKLRSYS